MALDGEIMRFIGNELMNTGSKGLAKAGAKATLSSLIPQVATKAATNLATNAGTDMAVRSGISALDSIFPKSENTIDLFRGQIKGNDNLYYNKGDGTKGSATIGNGFFMTPNEAKTEPWRGEGIEPVHLRANKSDLLTRDELVAKTNWANDMLGDLDAMKNLYTNDPQQAELIEALATGHLPEVSKYLDKPFIQPDSGQGEELAETVFFPDTRPELTNQYRDILKQNANPYTPAGIEKANIANGRLSDANGNPMRVYHSTPNEFSEFDDSMLGDNTYASNTAYGHFTTPDKEFSSRFRDINNEGKTGRTMELQVKSQKPITHPYDAGLKYGDAESDQIVRNYFKAVGAEESLAELEADAVEDGLSLYEEYMSRTLGEDPFEAAQWEREDLMKNGYDAMEIIEGPRNKMVDGAKETTPVSSIVAFEGKNLRPTTHLPISAIESEGADIPVNKAVMDKVAKYLEAPTDANADGVINWNDVKSIYAQAQEQQKVLDKLARSISEKEGYPEYQDFSPKSIDSMKNKVARKGGDYSLASMKDHTRNKIMMNSWNDAEKTINDIAEVFGGTPAVEYVVNDWGYKGLHITGRFDNGLGWELQLTTPEDWPRKLRSDAIYDKWRNVKLDTASPKEVMGYLNAMRDSNAIWAESRIPDLSMYDNTTPQKKTDVMAPNPASYVDESGKVLPGYYVNGRGKIFEVMDEYGSPDWDMSRPEAQISYDITSDRSDIYSKDFIDENRKNRIREGSFKRLDVDKDELLKNLDQYLDEGETYGGVSRRDERPLSIYTYATPENEMLRSGKSIEDIPSAQAIMGVMNRTVGTTGTFYRGLNSPEAAKTIQGAKVGDVYVDKGFLSTDWDKDLAKEKFSSGGVLLEIKNNIRRPGTNLSLAPYTRDLSEHEMLFAPNTRLKITGITKEGDTTVYKMEVLGQ